ncbi:potassium transporter Kef [Microbacterium sp. 22215]|uniref:potassium transporter Kef n=1 Tax=Microbacterium sp. 22215 TaxID=3453893 RepID=UPI003F8291BC
MNRVPVQLANVSAPFPPAELPDLASAGLDASVAASSVRSAHGDPLLFARALAAGAAHDPAALTDRERALGLVSLAGWRAGALGLRTDALARLDRLDSAEQRLAAAATLGLGVDALDEFRRRQRDDRFWWPGRADQRGYVLATGGFRGLGGAWIRPPERVEFLADAGAFGFLVAGSWWRLDSDVWGARLALLPDRPETVAPRDDAVSIVIGPDTHLAWVHVREPQ